MTGIFVIFGSKKLEEDSVQRAINIITHEEYHQIDQFRNNEFTGVRIHLGIFNPHEQPLWNKERTVCIFFDGKLFGHKEKFEELKKTDEKIDGDNDAAYCLSSYLAHGTDFIKELDGSFICAIYDTIQKKLTIFNDRFGYRVHFFSWMNGCFILSPEAKAILQIPGFKRELNLDAVAEWFAFGKFLGNKTYFKGIYLLPPASLIEISDDVFSSHSYWELTYQPDYSKTEDEVIEDLIISLRKSVSDRIDTKHRYGITLSGGLDSRTVLAAVPELRKNTISTFTFGNGNCDEVTIARKVSSRARVKKHFFFPLDTQDILDHISKDVWLHEGRNYIGLSFVHATLDTIRKESDVIFDGFAMDLTLGGSYLSQEILSCENRELLQDMLSHKRVFSDEEMSKVLVDSFYNKIKKIPQNSFEAQFSQIPNLHPGNISDKFAMDNHVAWMHVGDVPLLNKFEVVHPTGGNSFFEILTSIPPEWRINHTLYRKFLMRLSPSFSDIRYQKTMVPVSFPQIIWNISEKWIVIKDSMKRKLFFLSKGISCFSNHRSYVNYNEWMYSDSRWEPCISSMVDLVKNNYSDILNADYLEHLYREHKAGKKDNSVKILYLITFIVFLDLFRDYYIIPSIGQQ
ncbi:asparagine synthase-related protein [Methanospirillum stamsii]|uniref:Uncharacterized protein n=1 Tax=Methanospirillum stamsii TaxID=1277351 RepID=A0A2V2N4C5_9EURY|nr:asparagine synthase-related protein [Methanospirillum stamsii]PWR70103.1 hypothetical protein DLD82_16450 [Methanospirillum stamsii]